MITQADLQHHLRREREERQRANQASSAEARLAHSALADSHARRATIAGPTDLGDPIAARSELKARSGWRLTSRASLHGRRSPTGWISFGDPSTYGKAPRRVSLKKMNQANRSLSFAF